MPPDNWGLRPEADVDRITVRRYRPGDQVACAWLFETIQREIFPNDDPGKFARDRFHVDTRGEEIWVAEADGEVIGFVTLWRPDPFIHFLLIHPDWRGRGIGTLLLDELLASVDRSVDLKCRADNTPARRFYLSNRWHEAGSGHQDGVTYIRFRKAPPHQRH